MNILEELVEAQEQEILHLRSENIKLVTLVESAHSQIAQVSQCLLPQIIASQPQQHTEKTPMLDILLAELIGEIRQSNQINSRFLQEFMLRGTTQVTVEETVESELVKLAPNLTPIHKPVKRRKGVKQSVKLTPTKNKFCSFIQISAKKVYGKQEHILACRM